MKKIKIQENELVDLIEKLVKENLSNGTGFDFGMVGTPTSKYKDLLEKDDIEEEDELEESNGEEEQLNVNVTDQPGSDNEDEWMESISESKLVKRLTRKLHEAAGKGVLNQKVVRVVLKKVVTLMVQVKNILGTY